jgi:hypothetical protein
MAISTNSRMVLRCPYCGDINQHDLSVFAFAGSHSCRLTCSCGSDIASLGTRDRKHFWVQADCSFCEETHFCYFNRKDIWGDEILSLYCDDTGLDIAYIGPRDKMEELVSQGEKSLAEMAQELGFGDYFSSPDIMYGVLDRLYKLAERGDLFCHCGNYDVEIEIYPDRLELKCGYCNASGLVMAQNDVDLEKVQGLQEIELTPRGFKCLEGKKQPNPKKHFKK